MSNIFENVESVIINNKEVKSIITSNNEIIFEADTYVLNSDLILTTDITDYIQLYLRYINFVDENNGITIDWGDGTVETVQKSNIIGHNYDNEGRYVIILYNVESLDNYAFQDCERIYKLEIPDNCELGYSIVDTSSIDEIHIPETVTFNNELTADSSVLIASHIKYLELNWTTPPINYDTLIYSYNELIDVISIPPNSFQSYANEGYEIWRLIDLEDQFECRIYDINNSMSNLKTAEYLFEGTFNIVKYDEYVDDDNTNIMKISLNDNNNVFNNNIFLLSMDSLTGGNTYVPLYNSVSNYINQNPSYYIRIKQWFEISNFYCVEYTENNGDIEQNNPNIDISIEINEYTYEGSISDFPRYFKLYPDSSYNVDMTTEEGHTGGGIDFVPDRHDFCTELNKYDY